MPSTQTCSNCGYRLTKDQRLDLNVKRWTCSKCNTLHDRDRNAANNIRAQAIVHQYQHYDSCLPGYISLSDRWSPISSETLGLYLNNSLVNNTVGHTGIYACGECVRPSVFRQYSKKQELIEDVYKNISIKSKKLEDVKCAGFKPEYLEEIVDVIQEGREREQDET